MNQFSLFDIKPRAIMLDNVVAVVGETTESYLTRVLGRPMIQVDGALPRATLDDLADRFRERTGVAVTCREDAPMHVVFEPTAPGQTVRPVWEVDAEEAYSTHQAWLSPGPIVRHLRSALCLHTVPTRPGCLRDQETVTRVARRITR